jgi:Tol biopolymer transport system component
LQARSYAGVDPTALRAGEPKQIARGAPCRPPIYLADGRLAVGSTVVDPQTGATVEFSVQGTELAWSPTGDKLALITTDKKEIRIAGPDGADAATKVRESGGLLSSLSWASDGKRLAYISQNDPATPARFGPGPPTVQILNVSSGEKTPAGPGLAVAWSPRQDVLAVERAGAVIEASNLQGGRSPLTTGQRPTWSADGNLLGVVREAEGGVSQGWVVQAADGSKAAPLAGDGVCAISFSPSGSKLAVVREGEQTTLLEREIEAPE